MSLASGRLAAISPGGRLSNEAASRVMSFGLPFSRSISPSRTNSAEPAFVAELASSRSVAASVEIPFRNMVRTCG